MLDGRGTFAASRGKRRGMTPIFQAVWVAVVVSVTDGDTVRVRMALWPEVTIETAVRLRGIDTPELHGHCERERKLALDARAALARMLTGQQVSLSEVTPDKYGGRVLARVSTVNGADVAGDLLKRGLAVSYSGRGPRRNWCAP